MAICSKNLGGMAPQAPTWLRLCTCLAELISLKSLLDWTHRVKFYALLTAQPRYPPITQQVLDISNSMIFQRQYAQKGGTWNVTQLLNSLLVLLHHNSF